MDSELMIIGKHLEGVFSAEEIFGELLGTSAEKYSKAKALYRELAKKTHPDRCGRDEQSNASRAFKRLGEFYAEARRKISDGTYGLSLGKTIELKIGKRAYGAKKLFRRGDIADVYEGEFKDSESRVCRVAIKIAADPDDSGFLTSEAKAVRDLDKAALGNMGMFKGYLPRIYDSFMVRTEAGRHAGNIFEFYGDYLTLRTAAKAYPKRLGGRDIAWIANRLFEVLGYVHRQGYVHGGLTPDHILIHPLTHGLRLVDWTASVRRGGKIPLMSAEYSGLYPPEAENGRGAVEATDIYMAAACLDYALDREAPDAINRFLDSCRIKNPARRPDDAWEARDDLESLLGGLYGRRKYHEFGK